MSLPFNSLLLRIVLAVALILVLAGTLIGWGIYQDVSHSVLEELEAKLKTKLAWIEGALELENGLLAIEPKVRPVAPLQHWRVATTDGKVLWSVPNDTPWRDGDAAYLSKTKFIEVGEEAGGPQLNGSDLSVSSESTTTNLPAYRMKNPHGKITLRVWAREPLARSREEINRVMIALWAIGPISVLCLAAILSLFIRWQLKPLAGMSVEAASIGPQNTDTRIGGVGSAIELVRLREAINSMVNRLAEGLRRERQFASTAAHELRTPLTQMRMNVEITLKKDRGMAEYKEAFAQTLDDIDRLQQLVANLLFLTRDYHGPEMQREVSVRDALLHAIKGSGSNALIPLDGTDVFVRGNDELVQCAFRNVLENAMRYAPGAPAEITVSTSEKMIEVHITDSGPGISAEDCERIFEPLTRLDEARTIGVDPGGFGLGLTVARNAMRACGGELRCKARISGGRGADFIFVFAAAGTPKAGWPEARGGAS